MSIIGKRLTRNIGEGGRFRSRAVGVILLGLGGPGVVGAQATITLHGRGEVHPAEFTRVTGVRELSDGRVLVVDGGEHVVRALDYATSASSMIGRTGDGPGEYRSPFGLYAIAGDSTLLTDGTTRKWFVLAGASIVQTITANRLLPERLDPDLDGSDTSGRVLYVCGQWCAGPPGTRGQSADSALVLLGDRATDSVIVLSRIRAPNITKEDDLRREVGGRRIVYVLRNPLPLMEQAILFPDDWIAIARVDPYRVDWRRPDGTTIRGAPLPDSPVRLTAREKEFAVERQFAEYPVQFHPEDIPEWNDFVPPFARDALLASSDGRVAILRTPSSQHPETRYDIVDRTGKLSGRLTLPENEHLAGFGAHTVYVVVTDDDGIQRLRRHPWP